MFVYDGGGKLVAEYDNNFTNPPPAPTTSYVATDTLQSVRVITNQAGEVTSRRDFMPFGEELFANSPNRTEAGKYTTSADKLRKRFTGYEKDTETGLDFAEARYYQNKHGRFTAVDPLLASGKSGNPQTFNRYTYVLNNPIILTDPDGLQAGNNIEPCRGANCGEFTIRGNTAIPDNPIAAFTIFLSETVEAFTELATLNDPLDSATYQIFQNRLNASNGDPEAAEALNSRAFGSVLGPRNVDVIEQTVTNYQAAVRTAEIGFSLQSMTFGFASMAGPGERASQ